MGTKLHFCFFFIINYSLRSWFQTFAVFWIYYVFFWVVPRRLNFICRRFGTLYLFHLHRQVVYHLSMKMEQIYHLSMKMEQIECSETSAYKIQTPGNYPKENIIYSLRHFLCFCYIYCHDWKCLTDERLLLQFSSVKATNLCRYAGCFAWYFGWLLSLWQEVGR